MFNFVLFYLVVVTDLLYVWCLVSLLVALGLDSVYCVVVVWLVCCLCCCFLGVVLVLCGWLVSFVSFVLMTGWLVVCLHVCFWFAAYVCVL